MTEKWEHFYHGADIGVRGWGPSREAALAQVALAATAVIADPATVAGAEPVAIQCEAPDDALLLAEWLNALVYEMATRRMLFSRFEVRLDGGRLQATAWGEKVDVARHQPAVEIKGATYTELILEPRDGGWMGQCVVDV